MAINLSIFIIILVHNEEVARYLVREGFLKTWRAINSFEGRSSFYTSFELGLFMGCKEFASLRRSRDKSFLVMDSQQHRLAVTVFIIDAFNLKTGS